MTETAVHIPLNSTTWILLTLFGIAVASVAVAILIPRAERKAPDGNTFLRRIRTTTGMPLESGIGIAAVSFVALVYLGLFLLAIPVTGYLLWNVFSNVPTDGAAGNPRASLGLGALLVALLGAPFLIWRSVVAQKTLDITQHGQVTDRINAAIEGLGAEKVVKEVQQFPAEKVFSPPRNETLPPLASFEAQAEWQRQYTYESSKPQFETLERTVPNMEVRVGAILALGRIARENLDFHVQVMQILCAYIRENAPTEFAKPFKTPKFLVNDAGEPLSVDRIQTYLAELGTELDRFRADPPRPRTDIQTALETLGRRTPEQKLREGAWPDAEGKTALVFDLPFPNPPPYPVNGAGDLHQIWRARFEKFREQASDLRFQFNLTAAYRHDLRGANLQGYNLGGLDLRGSRMEGAKLQAADLRGARLTGAQLNEAQFQGARMNAVQLQGANLEEAKLQGASLDEAQLQGARLDEAQLQEAYLFGAELQGASLDEAQLQGAILIGAELQGASLDEAQLQGAILNGAELQGASLDEAQLQGANLVGAELQRVEFCEAQLQGANFDGANLQGADLRWALLQGVSFDETQLQGAKLRGAELKGVNLERAQLDENTDLSDSALRGAALMSVDEKTLAQLTPHGSETILFAETCPDDWLGHFVETGDDFSYEDFITQWRAWAATLDPPVTIAPDFRP